VSRALVPESILTSPEIYLSNEADFSEAFVDYGRTCYSENYPKLGFSDSNFLDGFQFDKNSNRVHNFYGKQPQCYGLVTPTKV
jgi:hypothetical protein